MAARATVLNYESAPTGLQFDKAGNFIIYANVLYMDTADPTKIFYNQPVITLPANATASWPDTIRQTLVTNGIINGFSDLITPSVSILVVPTMYTEQVGTQSVQANITTTPRTLISFAPLESGLLNLFNRRMTVRGTLIYQTAILEVPIITLNLEIFDGSDILGLVSIASSSVSASQGNTPIRFSFNAVTVTPGTSAVFIGTGELLVTNLGITVPRNMLPEYVSTNQIDITGGITVRLTISVNAGNLHACQVVEAFLTIE